jgi:hypothetical protein
VLSEKPFADEAGTVIQKTGSRLRATFITLPAAESEIWGSAKAGDRKMGILTSQDGKPTSLTSFYVYQRPDISSLSSALHFENDCTIIGHASTSCLMPGIT